eukprot:GILK01008912.1.p1 GENE.GILK01008912.1~~GILK01008912.1.p1  ORF type:complete len:267 (+),score=30.72 GILK01008912.1:83-802(+)
MDIEAQSDNLLSATFGGQLHQRFAASVVSSVFASTRSHASGFRKAYANIDVFRPYFDVESRDVLKRLIKSLVPEKQADQTHSFDLYGPTMLVFTLVAVLQLDMKLAMVTVREGSLIGTAMGTSFSYWLGASGLFYAVAYFLSIPISLLAVLSSTGYALFGYCITLLIDALFGSGFLFYVALVLFGGSSAGTLGSRFFNASSDPQKGLIAAGSVAACHFLFLLYLHYAYAAFYTAVADLR